MQSKQKSPKPVRSRNSICSLLRVGVFPVLVIVIVIPRFGAVGVVVDEVLEALVVGALELVMSASLAGAGLQMLGRGVEGEAANTSEGGGSMDGSVDEVTPG